MYSDNREIRGHPGSPSGRWPPRHNIRYHRCGGASVNGGLGKEGSVSGELRNVVMLQVRASTRYTSL